MTVGVFRDLFWGFCYIYYTDVFYFYLLFRWGFLGVFIVFYVGGLCGFVLVKLVRMLG